MAAFGSAYVPLVSPVVWPHLSFLFCLLGLFFMSWFFVTQVKSKSHGVLTAASAANLIKELVIAMIGSFFLGFGILFLALNVGCYV